VSRHPWNNTQTSVARCERQPLSSQWRHNPRLSSGPHLYLVANNAVQFGVPKSFRFWKDNSLPAIGLFHYLEKNQPSEKIDKQSTS
jgi:hypothetical protein